MTSYHKLGGSKQHKFITLQFWRPEIYNGSHWDKNQCEARAVFLLEALEENPTPYLFQILEVATLIGLQPLFQL